MVTKKIQNTQKSYLKQDFYMSAYIMTILEELVIFIYPLYWIKIMK